MALNMFVGGQFAHPVAFFCESSWCQQNVDGRSSKFEFDILTLFCKSVVYQLITHILNKGTIGYIYYMCVQGRSLRGQGGGQPPPPLGIIQNQISVRFFRKLNNDIIIILAQPKALHFALVS